MTTSESTKLLRYCMPFAARFQRFLPSKVKGLVTTATVRAPQSIDAFAMIGAAPVPVPPPMPAVMNTMSASWMLAITSSMLSSAAFWPISGFAPAPRPPVIFSPSWILISALHLESACLSVLTPMNVTPCSPASTMRLIALHPPPPIPTTLMIAALSGSETKSETNSIMKSSSK